MGFGLRRTIKQMYHDCWRRRVDVMHRLLGYEPLLRDLVNCPREIAPYILRKLGCRVGANVDIQPPVYLHNVNKGAANLHIGNHVHIGRETHLDMHDKLTISDNCTVSMGCKLLTHQDVGHSPVISILPREHDPVTLEAGVYLGAGVTVLKGVTLGMGAVVAAGALVNQSLEAKTINAGLPARKIKTYE